MSFMPWTQGMGNVKGLIRCALCQRKSSVIAGTIFEGTRKPLRFLVSWYVADQKFSGNLGPCAKRVALLKVAAFDSALEPPDTLLRRTVRERLWHGVAARPLLQSVVADGAGGGQCLLDFARF